MFSEENITKKAAAFFHRHKQQPPSEREKLLIADVPKEINKISQHQHEDQHEDNDHLLREEKKRRRSSYIYAIDTDNDYLIQTSPTNPNNTTMTADLKRDTCSKEESLPVISWTGQKEEPTSSGDGDGDSDSIANHRQRNRYVRSATSVSVARLLSDGCSSLLQRLRRLPNVEKRLFPERKSVFRDKSVEKQQQQRYLRKDTQATKKKCIP